MSIGVVAWPGGRGGDAPPRQNRPRCQNGEKISKNAKIKKHNTTFLKNTMKYPGRDFEPPTIARYAASLSKSSHVFHENGAWHLHRGRIFDQKQISKKSCRTVPLYPGGQKSTTTRPLKMPLKIQTIEFTVLSKTVKIYPPWEEINGVVSPLGSCPSYWGTI